MLYDAKHHCGCDASKSLFQHQFNILIDMQQWRTHWLSLVLAYGITGKICHIEVKSFHWRNCWKWTVVFQRALLIQHTCCLVKCFTYKVYLLFAISFSPYFHSYTMTVDNLYSQFLQHYSLLCWLVISFPPPSNQIYHGTISSESPAAVTNVGFSVLKSLTQSRTNHQSHWTAIPRAFYDCEMNAFESRHRLPCHSQQSIRTCKFINLKLKKTKKTTWLLWNILYNPLAMRLQC